MLCWKLLRNGLRWTDVGLTRPVMKKRKRILLGKPRLMRGEAPILYNCELPLNSPSSQFFCVIRKPQCFPRKYPGVWLGCWSRGNASTGSNAITVQHCSVLSDLTFSHKEEADGRTRKTADEEETPLTFTPATFLVYVAIWKSTYNFDSREVGQRVMRKTEYRSKLQWTYDNNYEGEYTKAITCHGMRLCARNRAPHLEWIRSWQPSRV